MNPWLWLLPLTSAAIGWLTNVVAVRMLFRPREPLRVPLLGIRLQGVVPRRRDELARTVGRIVQEELLPMDGLAQHLDVARFREDVVGVVVRHVEERVRANLPAFLPGKVRDALTQYLQQVARREAAELVSEVSQRVHERVREEFDVATLAEERMRALDLEQLELLVGQVAGRELRHIELLGALLGLVIGLLQLGLLLVAGLT